LRKKWQLLRFNPASAKQADKKEYKFVHGIRLNPVFVNTEYNDIIPDKSGMLLSG
jgi:hypothetical protein